MPLIAQVIIILIKWKNIVIPLTSWKNTLFEIAMVEKAKYYE